MRKEERLSSVDEEENVNFLSRLKTALLSSLKLERVSFRGGISDSILMSGGKEGD